MIQNKKRKRKTATPNNESNKRPSLPLRDQDTHIEKSLPSLPSLAKNPVGSDTNVIQGHDHMKSPEVLAGFVYDPSLPMTYEYQLIAFQRQKTAKEKQADRNIDSKTPSRVIKLHPVSYISPVVHSSETHHNLNTLVDAATKMKPVSKETQHKTEKHSERNKSYGYHVSSGQNPALISGSGHESDSSGSGSISPVRKKPTKQLKDGKLLTGGGTNLKVPRDESSRQPDTPAFGNMPFQFDLSLQPISPGDDNSEKDHPVKKINSSIISGTNSYPSCQWGGPFDQPFAMPPTTFGQPPSVIQDKKRKRKTATPNNESNKRPSPPLRDQDTHIEKSLPPLPPSLAKNPVGRNTNVIQGHDHMKSPEVLAGFVYDPSLPMTYEYQLIAFQRRKAAEEKQADRNIDSKTPPRVIKQPHPVDHLLPYETTPQSNRQHSPLPPPHSGTFGRNKVVAPGVLISPDQRVMNPHSLPIKQEQLSRPNRPSSKGNHTPSTLKPPSHQPKKQSSRRSESHSGIIQIKQEPESLAMSHHHHQPGFLTFPGLPLPPGSTPTFQALSQGIVTSASPSSSSGVLQDVSVVPPPAWHVSGIINPPSSLKSEPHTVRNQQEHHMARMNTTARTRPNSHKKPHDWHHHGGIHHVITTNKQEPESLAMSHHHHQPEFLTFPGLPLPPGSTPTFQALSQGIVTSASPSSSSGVLQDVSVVPPPAWHVSGIINPPSSLKSEPHTVRNQQEHHMARMNTTARTRPNSHKKPHDWHHHGGIHHVITTNKQEPESLAMSHHHHQPEFLTFPGLPLPPGSTPTFQALSQGIVTSASPSSSSGVLQDVSVVPPPAWHVSGIINPPSSLKSEPHTVRNQQEHHMARMNTTARTRPNSHKKPHDWHHHGGIHHVITTNKQEPESLAMSHHHHQPEFLTFPGLPLPPGSTPTFQALSQGIVTSASPSSSSGVLQDVSVVPPPAWHVSGIINPPSSLKSEFYEQIQPLRETSSILACK